MQFNVEMISAFRRISYDNNPLHSDEIYARKTPFGKIVVFGMAGVLLALSEWAQGRCFSLAKIRGKFIKPLFLNEEYSLEIEEVSNSVKLKIVKNDFVRASISFEWLPYNQNDKINFASIFCPVLVARSCEQKKWGNLPDPITYNVDDAKLAEFCRRFSMTSSQFPRYQLLSLCWASYFVGMEVPGKQALFTGFSFNYKNNGDIPKEFTLNNMRCRYDDMFGKVTLSGDGTGISSFSIDAFCRPDPVKYGITDMKKVIGESDVLKNKVVLITGSSRGFGSVMAKVFALHGATVLINGKSDKGDMENVAAEIVSESKGYAKIVTGDMSNLTDCYKIRDEITGSGYNIDILVNNASPSINMCPFFEQTENDFANFVDTTIKLTYLPCRTFLPIMNKNGIVVNVSTVYTKKIEQGFSHYITAKHAVEGFTKAMAAEFHEIKFVIARPPRMLTDQTNAVFDVHKPVSAVGVAQSLFRRIQNLSFDNNLYEVDLNF